MSKFCTLLAAATTTLVAANDPSPSWLSVRYICSQSSAVCFCLILFNAKRHGQINPSNILIYILTFLQTRFQLYIHSASLLLHNISTFPLSLPIHLLHLLLHHLFPLKLNHSWTHSFI